MQIRLERVIHKVGNDSFAITLPKAWVTGKKLTYGDMVEVIVDEDVVIKAKTVPKTTAET